ncbi:hypothetical protein V6X63_08755 [Spiribacter sp. 221]|uniref:hypothetical protein n=1 Tax=Spiribacter onubensis TaxID=3122420 RepID=UPI00349F72F5
MVWVGPGVSLEKAESVRDSVNVRRKIIPDDYPLARELTLALCDFRIRTEVDGAELSLAEARKYLSELHKAVARYLDVSREMGELAFSFLNRSGAFRGHQAGLSRQSMSDALAEKVAIENRLQTFLGACTAAQSQIEGKRPGKRYMADVAVMLLADVYEEATGRTAYAKEDDSTPFTRFVAAARPLFGVRSLKAYSLRQILRDRKKRSTNLGGVVID